MSAHEERDPSLGAITSLLRDIAEGREKAQDELFDAIYAELHRRAAALMRRQPDGHTLQATALIGEVYGRLFKDGQARWVDEQHFLLTASRAMRQLLMDHARKKAAMKRAGVRVPLQEDLLILEFENRALDVEALHAALDKLAQINPEMARSVELRFFGNVPIEECARMAGISVRSFHRRWAMTKAWLFEELR